MRLNGTWPRGALLAAALIGLAGCEDQLPTATGEDRFPAGGMPATVQLVLEPEAFLRADTVFSDFATRRDAPYLLVANDFDGALDAHSLVRLRGFPDSVTYSVGGTSTTDAEFVYTAGTVVAVVDSLASFPRVATRLRLYELDQAWDSASVSWELAVDRPGEEVSWEVPGGTPGALIGEAVWTPGDTATADSVVWQVDSLTVERLSRDDSPGLLVTNETAGSRVQLSRLALRAGVRPESRPDTTLTRTISSGPQTFVFTPPPPQDPGVFRIGGITEARTVLTLDLDQSVPGCADPESQPNCPMVLLRDVTVNQAVLVLQPVAVPGGFRPVSAAPVLIRRVLEPELGRLAPLGNILASDTVTASVFDTPGSREVVLNLTSAVVSMFQRVADQRAEGLPEDDLDAVTIALLGERAARQFGYAWFSESPRLRLVYTLPLTPQLP